eukprot:492034_1
MVQLEKRRFVCGSPKTISLSNTSRQSDWISSLKKLVLPGDVYVALQIWDIGGQSVGSKMIKNYIFGADAVLLCYDITNYESFQNLDEWIGLVERACTEATMPYLALVGNKKDLEHVRTVKSEKHLRLADERSMFGYFM